MLSEATKKKQEKAAKSEKSDVDRILAEVKKVDPTQEGQAKLLLQALKLTLSENVSNWTATFRSNMRTELDMMSVHLSRLEARKAKLGDAEDREKICACPKCGNAAPRVKFVGFTQNSGRQVICFRCKNQSPAKPTEAEAISAWNEAAEQGIVLSDGSVLR